MEYMGSPIWGAIALVSCVRLGDDVNVAREMATRFSSATGVPVDELLQNADSLRALANHLQALAGSGVPEAEAHLLQAATRIRVAALHALVAASARVAV